jgi:hypothetical protein
MTKAPAAASSGAGMHNRLRVTPRLSGPSARRRWRGNPGKLSATITVAARSAADAVRPIRPGHSSRKSATDLQDEVEAKRCLHLTVIQDGTLYYSRWNLI